MIEYKGYIADIEYDDSVNMLHGRVANSGPYSIADCLASDIEGLKREFAISIDIYLASCVEDGVEPLPPEPLGEFLSERLHLRLDETLLGRVAQAARDSDQSLEHWVAQALERSLAAETPTPQV
ncbi:MAG: type II toxin-antitoxin system HicB family antitoxin [Anaerolineaceae bacterium]|nr:type II toxin-antitoxin system HicB family antitoxin [Anaerolineaceae bacterium]